ncbi:MAG: FimV/HubP family polar landmark protein [Methylovulum miyakonense]|uniref:FimV/HubP family polar landmark protein n=1 Tax=Methylovulum miyakonense TaxID=645578 RepID=UPI003BB5852E
MRNLTKTLAVVSLLVPASAHPLGIGEIKLHSALNQNLDAEIALVLSAGEKVADIKVNLASPDKFDETGIPWSSFLSKLKFQTIESDNKRVVIKISSREVLKEPFLDFLLQVSWPKGDLYREFTLLVDPPTEYAQSAVPVSEAPDSYGSESRPTYAAPAQRARKPRALVTASLNSERYGPTAKNDTLWKIAGRIGNDSGVSMEQLMVALYDANHGAFYKANVNALLPEKTLKIPTKEDILKLSKSDALYEFNRQMQAWKNPSAVARIREEAVQEQGQAVENQLTLSAPAQDSVNGAASVASPDQVGSGAATAQATTGSDQKNKLGQASADEAIQAKIAALEKQLSTMQELIALKDQQLAALQNQAQSTLPAQAAPPAQTAVTPIAEPVKPIPQQAASGDAQTIQTPKEPAMQAAIPAPVPGGDLPNKAQTPVPAPTPAEKKPPVRRVTTPVAEEGISIWTYLGFGVAGIGLLGGLGWFWQQRRKTDYDDLFEPASRSKSEKELAGSELEDSNNEVTTSDNLFVSDINSGEFDVFDMEQTEIDPISEADVYLAYGRYQQAEDLMRHAIDEQPSRDEFKLKLLEIFYANENKQAFEKYTAELIDEGKIDDAGFWAKVTEMGSEICPDSIFFSVKTAAQPVDLKKNAAGAGLLATNDDAGKEEGKIDEMDFDLASFEELFYSEDSGNPAERLFDLEHDKNITQPVNVKAGSDNKNDSIDFDLDDLSFETPVLERANEKVGVQLGKSPSLKNNDEFETFDFDLSPPKAGSDLASANSGAPVAQANSELSTLDFDFSPIEADTNDNRGLEFEGLTLSPSRNTDESLRTLDFSTDNAPKTNLFSEDSLSVDFSFDKQPLGFSEQGIEAFGVANLSEMDEMETKLDLAMAYIDMGDREAAHEIAREVLEKGSPEQQLIAKALLENKH